MVLYYKKQVEVARQFGVSEGTITNWLKNAINRKNNIQIIEIEGDTFIAKSEHNRVEMSKMAQNARKYRSDETEKDVVADKELYEIMEENQLVSLINSIIIRREIPLKYSFLGKGAKYWQEFYKQTTQDATYTISSSDVYLLKNLYSQIIEYVENYSHFNIIDIGSGDLLPVIDFIKSSIKSGKLKQYVSVDISKNIIKITEANFTKNFQELPFTYCNLDIETVSLEDVLYKYKNFNLSQKKVRNIILFLGSTIGNMGDINHQVKVLQNIRDGMGSDDLLIVSNAFDTVVNRTHFPKFLLKNGDKQELYLPSLLGIEKEDYDKEFVYNETKHIREYNLVLNKNINISFDKLSQKFDLMLELKKGDKVNIWKHRRDTFEFISEKMKRAGLALEFVVRHPIDPEVIYMAKVAD